MARPYRSLVELARPQETAGSLIGRQIVLIQKTTKRIQKGQPAADPEHSTIPIFQDNLDRTGHRFLWNLEKFIQSRA
jgi:hypothetical protein